MFSKNSFKLAFLLALELSVKSVLALDEGFRYFEVRSNTNLAPTIGCARPCTDRARAQNKCQEYSTSYTWTGGRNFSEGNMLELERGYNANYFGECGQISNADLLDETFEVESFRNLKVKNSNLSGAEVRLLGERSSWEFMSSKVYDFSIQYSDLRNIKFSLDDLKRERGQRLRDIWISVGMLGNDLRGADLSSTITKPYASLIDYKTKLHPEVKYLSLLKSNYVWNSEYLGKFSLNESDVKGSCPQASLFGGLFSSSTTKCEKSGYLEATSLVITDFWWETAGDPIFLVDIDFVDSKGKVRNSRFGSYVQDKYMSLIDKHVPSHKDDYFEYILQEVKDGRTSASGEAFFLVLSVGRDQRGDDLVDFKLLYLESEERNAASATRGFFQENLLNYSLDLNDGKFKIN